jgi:cytochrome c peroxidase
MRRRRNPLAPAIATGLLAFICACDSNPTSPSVTAGMSASKGAVVAALTGMEQLGKSIFFDQNLSINSNQSCAACHDPQWGFTGPIEAFNAAGAVYEGSIAGRFGNRKPPSAAYATPSPIFHLDKGLFVGGNFWDGRATGEKLGNPAADQAQGPFLNPVEQALPDNACVVYRICMASYPVSFTTVFGAGACGIAWPADVEAQCASESGAVSLSAADRGKVDAAYDNMALAIAAYEGSSEVNLFTSKLDAGRRYLTKEEKKGFALFKGKAKCAKCHIATGKQALFTDFTFDNIGVPKNPQNPALLADPSFVDLGLGGFLRSTPWSSMADDEDGKQKVPTLRNVDTRPFAGAVKAFTHNGYFKTLEQVVHFYNTRDVKPTCPGDYTAAQAMAADCWPEPEVSDNVNTDELGDLGLSAEEEAAIVAFMKTLSDGFMP